MTNELVKILATAKEYMRRSMIWFELYQNSKDEIDWQTCKELTTQCDTMLEAYEIITGRKVYRHDIDKELVKIETELTKQIIVMLN